MQHYCTQKEEVQPMPSSHQDHFPQVRDQCSNRYYRDPMHHPKWHHSFQNRMRPLCCAHHPQGPAHQSTTGTQQWRKWNCKICCTLRHACLYRALAKSHPPLWRQNSSCPTHHCAWTHSALWKHSLYSAWGWQGWEWNKNSVKFQSWDIYIHSEYMKQEVSFPWSFL